MEIVIEYEVNVDKDKVVSKCPLFHHSAAESIDSFCEKYQLKKRDIESTKRGMIRFRLIKHSMYKSDD